MTDTRNLVERLREAESRMMGVHAPTAEIVRCLLSDAAAALSAQAARIPREPTEKMLLAARAAYAGWIESCAKRPVSLGTGTGWNLYLNLWRAMYDAALSDQPAAVASVAEQGPTAAVRRIAESVQFLRDAYDEAHQDNNDAGASADVPASGTRKQEPDKPPASPSPQPADARDTEIRQRVIEECAKVCDDYEGGWPYPEIDRVTREDCAKRIRALAANPQEGK